MSREKERLISGQVYSRLFYLSSFLSLFFVFVVFRLLRPVDEKGWKTILTLWALMIMTVMFCTLIPVCISMLDNNCVLFFCTALNTPLSVSRSLTSGTDSLVSSRVSSHALASDTGSMETVIEARPVSEEEALKVPETILEAQPVVEESVYNVKDTYAASQVRFSEPPTPLLSQQ